MLFMKCDNPESLIPDIHIGNEIARYMSRERYSPSWLAKKLYCDRTNVYKILRKSSIDVALLMRISVALRHDFFYLYSGAVEYILSENEKDCETHAPQSPKII